MATVEAEGDSVSLPEGDLFVFVEVAVLKRDGATYGRRFQVKPAGDAGTAEAQERCRWSLWVPPLSEQLGQQLPADGPGRSPGGASCAVTLRVSRYQADDLAGGNGVPDSSFRWS